MTRLTRNASSVLIALSLAWPLQGHAITRTEVMERAVEFAEHVWTMTSANTHADCSAGYVSDYSPGTYTGLPYDWGGHMTVSEFDSQIAAGYGAGSHSSDGILSCTAGLDCSGFVSQCWQSGHYSTSTFHQVSYQISADEVLEADAYNDSGSHIVLFAYVAGDGSPVFYEASGSASKVRLNTTASWSYFNGYVPIRYNNIQDGPPRTDGSFDDPIPISLPYHGSDNTGRNVSDEVDVYSCMPSSGAENGPEIVYVFTVSGPGTLHAWLTDPSGVDVDLQVLQDDQDPYNCLGRDDGDLTVELPRGGTYYLVCDTWSNSSGTEYPGSYTLDVTFSLSTGCGADGWCNDGCGSDPDCAPDCSANGVCNDGCANDPDCAPVCVADGVCNSECANDPDCAPVCVPDGFCNTECADDPDCDPVCHSDGFCNPECGFDPDCGPVCVPDGFCNTECADDPDCDPDCGADGFCDPGCAIDPDCGPVCIPDGLCNPACGDDPDCDPVCIPDDWCNLDCADDPDCDDICLFDGWCNPACGADPDCGPSCEANGQCEPGCPVGRDPDCAPVCVTDEWCNTECDDDPDCNLPREADGYCDPNHTDIDPDCGTPCGINGWCNPDCGVSDPDCPQLCESDSWCDPHCGSGVDPDCSCGADGFCDASCPFGVDPDCSTDPCATDGTCNPNCPPNHDQDCPPACLADGWCDGECQDDPDCSCPLDGVCDEACGNEDPDCNASCGEDGVCMCGDIDPDCTEGEDPCEANGWYGDGACDPSCPEPDPDCTPPPVCEGDGVCNIACEAGLDPDCSADPCELYGQYGDGICQVDCFNPDPDCSADQKASSPDDTGCACAVGGESGGEGLVLGGLLFLLACLLRRRHPRP